MLDQIGIVAGIIGAVGAVPVILAAWRRPWHGAARWWSSRRTRLKQEAATRDSLQDGVLREGCLVVAKLGARPSSTWLDPPAQLQGVWDEKRMVPLPSPLRYAGRGGRPEPQESTWVPLVIPGLKVESEWREATHVQSCPLWRSLKGYVVARFLQSIAGKDLVCSVVSGRKKGGVLLNCRDYDECLQSEWPYFKGLEAVLAVNALYRQQRFMRLSDGDLKDFVFHNLPVLLSKAAIERAPKQYRRALGTRPADPHAVYLVLKGLIDRYRQSGISPLSS